MFAVWNKELDKLYGDQMCTYEQIPLENKFKYEIFFVQSFLCLVFVPIVINKSE